MICQDFHIFRKQNSLVQHLPKGSYTLDKEKKIGLIIIHSNVQLFVYLLILYRCGCWSSLSITGAGWGGLPGAGQFNMRGGQPEAGARFLEYVASEVLVGILSSFSVGLPHAVREEEMEGVRAPGEAGNEASSSGGRWCYPGEAGLSGCRCSGWSGGGNDIMLWLGRRHYDRSLCTCGVFHATVACLSPSLHSGDTAH